MVGKNFKKGKIRSTLVINVTNESKKSPVETIKTAQL